MIMVVATVCAMLRTCIENYLIAVAKDRKVLNTQGQVFFNFQSRHFKERERQKERERE